MARMPLTYGAKDLNDGVIWTLMDKPDFGERIKTYDERRSYAGNVAQYNVTEANLIPMHLPLKLQGASIANLRAEIDALNALIDAGEQDLVFNDGSGAITYSCAHSPRVQYPRSAYTQACWEARIDLALVRYPE